MTSFPMGVKRVWLDMVDCQVDLGDYQKQPHGDIRHQPLSRYFKHVGGLGGWSPTPHLVCYDFMWGFIPTSSVTFPTRYPR